MAFCWPPLKPAACPYRRYFILRNGAEALSVDGGTVFGLARARLRERERGKEGLSFRARKKVIGVGVLNSTHPELCAER